MHPRLENLAAKYPDLQPILDSVGAAYALMLECYQAGGKLLICGNGGSAADSEHLVAELMKGYLSARELPAETRARLLRISPEAGEYLASRLQGALPAISLASQTALLTAIANDVAGDMMFAQQVYGYGRPGDVLVAISTSGRSRSVVNAALVARALGVRVLGMLGESGGELKKVCDVAVCVPQALTADVQERHLALYHTLCAMLEEALFPTNSAARHG